MAVKKFHRLVAKHEVVKVGRHFKGFPSIWIIVMLLLILALWLVRHRVLSGCPTTAGGFTWLATLELEV